MRLTPELINDLDLLSRYNLSTTMEGIKVHKDAETETIATIKRLYENKILTQVDGGYLTDLGREVAEHIQSAIRILSTLESEAS